MPSTIYKPKRTKKYYNKRSKIFMTDKFQRQNTYRKKKSVVYQNTRFHIYGSEFSLVITLQALTAAIGEFNMRYGDELHPRHGMLLILIKHYLTQTGNEAFKPDDIYTYYPNPEKFFGYFAEDSRKFKVLFNDLMHLDFLNPSGVRYIPNMRMKFFLNAFEKYCKDHFIEEEQ